MGEITTREAFLRVKPLCDLLLSNPSRENAKNICECLRTFPKPIMQNLMEYLLFPPVVHLESNVTSTEMRLHLLNVMEAILRDVNIMKVELFFKLYMILVRQAGDVKNPTVLISEHEELKLCVMHSLKNLFLSASSDVIESIYTRNNSLKLSESFFLCVSIARSEKYSALRIAAIETLIALAYIHDEADISDIVLRSQVADIVMLYLPGIVRGMLDIAERNETQSHKVTLMAIRALGRVISLVMEDLPTEPTLQIFPRQTPSIADTDPLGITTKLSGKSEMDKHLQTTVRNSNWLKAASEKLIVPLKTLSDLPKHSHPKVRKELITTVSLLLTKCPQNLSESVPALVDIIIALSEDNEDEVKMAAKLSLEEIQHSIISNLQMKSTTSLLEENFYKLISKLPRLMRRSENAAQLSYLNQLTGYLRIFGEERLPKILSSTAHIRRLLLALVYVIELDFHEVSILNEAQIMTIEDTSHVSTKGWKNFKFIQDPKVHDQLIIVCQLLGELSDVSVLIDNIIELMSDIPQYQKELTLLLNWVLMTQNPNLRALFEQLINYYIDDELWYLPIEMEEHTSLSQIQSNIVQSCLLMEGLGIFALALGDDYQQFLLKTLYLIIERAGNKNRLISSIGVRTLEQFARSQGYSNAEAGTSTSSANITSLLRENVDYISYHVTVKLRRVERNPGVLDVVTIVMKYSTLDFLPCLKEIVIEALGQLKIASQERSSHSILKVLYTFVICIGRQVHTNQNESSQDRKEDTAETIIKALVDYYRAKRTAELIDQDVDVTEDKIEDIDELTQEYTNPEEPEEKIPEYIHLVDDILKCSLNFVPSKKIPESLIAMEILKEGLKVLSSWTNQLLPIVHQLWHPLVDRFKESNVLIMNRAWQLFHTVAMISEDFVRSRTMDQVSPSIAKFLNISAKESYGKDSKNAYKFTQMFKLQVMILSQLGELAGYLKLQERQVWQMLEMVEGYFREEQHPQLQECCVDLYKTVCRYNADIVWVKCLRIFNDSAQEGTKDGVPNFMGEEETSTQDPCGKNLLKILKYIDTMKKSNTVSL